MQPNRPSALVFLTDSQPRDSMAAHGNPPGLPPKLDRAAHHGDPECPHASRRPATGRAPRTRGYVPAALFLLIGCLSISAQPPNILFAIADDWGWPHAGVYGDPVVRTPAFDRVAREGILFHHAYVSSPSCTPSRNAILTGQYHWRLGPGASLWSTLDPGIPVYPHLLEAAGYHVGYYRKSWGPGRLGDGQRHPAGKAYPTGGLEEFLAERPEGTPFCFWLGSTDPHRGYEAGSGVRSGMDPTRIRLLECLPDHPIVRGDVADYYFEVQRFDALVNHALRLLEELGELENTLVIMTGDNGMPFPRGKANNYDSGVRVPLAMRWGSGIVAPAREFDGFVSLTDLAPTFLEMAGMEIPGDMTGQSLIPVFRSARTEQMESGPRAFVLHGKERHVPAQEDHMGGYPSRAIRTHQFLYIRNFHPDRWPAGTPNYLEAAIPYCWLGDCDNGPTKTYLDTNRDKDATHRRLWDLAFAKRPAEELYACGTDPGQLENLADHPAYASIKSRLAEQLMNELARTGDPRVGSAEIVFDQYPYYGMGPRHPSYSKAPP